MHVLCISIYNIYSANHIQGQLHMHHIQYILQHLNTYATYYERNVTISLAHYFNRKPAVRYYINIVTTVYPFRSTGYYRRRTNIERKI